MSSIYDISGTTSNAFSINGKVNLLQGDDEPKVYQGQDGDVYFQTIGKIWSKRNGAWTNIESSLSDFGAPASDNQFMVASNSTTGLDIHYVDGYTANEIDDKIMRTSNSLSENIANNTSTLSNNISALNNRVSTVESNKLNTDLSNISDVTKRRIVHFSAPNYSAGISKNVGVTYTAEYDGILEIWTTKYGAHGGITTVIVNGIAYQYTVDNYGHGGIYRHLLKGDTFSVTLNNSNVTSYILFPVRG